MLSLIFAGISFAILVMAAMTLFACFQLFRLTTDCCVERDDIVLDLQRHFETD